MKTVTPRLAFVSSNERSVSAVCVNLFQLMPQLMHPRTLSYAPADALVCSRSRYKTPPRTLQDGPKQCDLTNNEKKQV